MKRLTIDEGQRRKRRGVEEEAGVRDVGVGHRAERGDFGGEEFALLLPNTRLEGAYALVDGIRALLEVQSRVEPSLGESVSGVTVSAGVAMYVPGESAAALIERADKCLYASKERGRNRVTTETGLAIH